MIKKELRWSTLLLRPTLSEFHAHWTTASTHVVFYNQWVVHQRREVSKQCHTLETSKWKAFHILTKSMIFGSALITTIAAHRCVVVIKLPWETHLSRIVKPPNRPHSAHHGSRNRASARSGFHRTPHATWVLCQ